MQTTASECTLVALLAGRARQMEGRPLSDTSRLVAYFSDQVHPKSLVPLWLEHQGCMQAQTSFATCVARAAWGHNARGKPMFEVIAGARVLMFVVESHALACASASPRARGCCESFSRRTGSCHSLLQPQ